MRRLVIFIVGPTAIGKTRLSIKLAKTVNGEIISADSMQVYRGMRILSQAPDANEKKKAKHHFLGFLDPRNEYSVAFFRDKAVKVIASIIKRKKVPIVVGGSGLYIKALIDGLFPSPPADLKFRSSMTKFVLKHGSRGLYEKLLKIDPDSAAHIHPNDTRRIVRALEIYHSSGRTMTELKRETKGLKDHYDIGVFGLTRASREDIYSAIDSRVERMFKEGAVSEVKRLKRKKLSKTAGAALGYKEIVGYLNGEYGLDIAKAVLKKNTRHFAKQQFTWFRADSRIRWFDLSKISEKEIINRIVRKVKA